MKLSRHIEFILSVLLLIGTFIAFQPMLSHDFLSIDDPVYVTDNSFVQKGLSLESLRWAFSTLHAEFYHPVTWLSLMLDTQLFGANPAGYLFTNLMLHIFNALLLYLILVKMTRQPLAGFFVALLFAVHPLHIESVAWIAERKDVLSTFFWMLSIWSYIAYVKKPHMGRFVILHLVYLIGLLAKAMLVTLPVVLLLLDYWPLERWRWHATETGNMIGNSFRLVKEKLFLFLLSASAGVVTIIAQHQGGGLDVMREIDLWKRLSNALVSILVYIHRTIWPGKLAVFYPFPNQIPIIHVLVSLSCIAAITVFSFRFRRDHPYLVTGWLWYLVTLLPVLGILKVGSFATADRYTYIPLIGIFIMVSWGLEDISKRLPRGKFLSGGLMGVVILGLFLTTTAQLKTWSDSKALFSHAAKVTRNNDFAHHALGHLYAASGDFEQAVAHFKQALKITPHRKVTQKDLARALVYQGRLQEAEACLEHLLSQEPDYGAAHYAMALLLAGQKRYEEALAHISIAFRRHPQYQNIMLEKQDTLRELYHHGLQSATERDPTKAKIVLESVLARNPYYYPARIGLADIMVSEKCFDGALGLFLGSLSDMHLKRLLAEGYRKWPVFPDAKVDPM